jgi:hypothetical protein
MRKDDVIYEIYITVEGTVLSKGRPVRVPHFVQYG